MPVNFVIPGPFQDRTTCELCAVITDDAGWLAIWANDKNHRVGECARQFGSVSAAAGASA